MSLVVSVAQGRQKIRFSVKQVFDQLLREKTWFIACVDLGRCRLDVGAEEMVKRAGEI